jgi:hypothetical protein
MTVVYNTFIAIILTKDEISPIIDHLLNYFLSDFALFWMIYSIYYLCSSINIISDYLDKGRIVVANVHDGGHFVLLTG